MKRFFCIALSAMLLLGMFALPAFAAEGDNAQTEPENKGYAIPDPDEVLDKALTQLEDAGVLEIDDNGDVTLACGDEIVTFAGNLERKIKDAVDTFLASEEYAKAKAEADIVIEDAQVKSILDSILSCWNSIVDEVVVVLNDEEQRAELERRLSEGCAFVHERAGEIRDDLQAKVESGELTMPELPDIDVDVDVDWPDAAEWDDFGNRLNDFFEGLFGTPETQAPVENN